MKPNANQLEALLLEFYDLRELAWLERHIAKDEQDREETVAKIYEWTVTDYAGTQGIVPPNIKLYYGLYLLKKRKV